MREVLDGIYEVVLNGNGVNGVAQIKIFIIPGRPGERSLMIDTGFKNADCMYHLEEALKSLGIRMTDLDIFLTHRHHDHSGLCPMFAKQGATIFMNPEEERHAYDCLAYKVTAESLEAQKKVMQSVGVTYQCAPGVYEFFRKIAQRVLSHGDWVLAGEAFPYRKMQAGRHFDYGDYHFEALSLRGHTYGQLGLIDEEKKLLFSADQLINGLSPIVATTYPDEGLLNGFFQSLEWIKHHCKEGWNILPAHGERIGNVQEAVDKTVFSYLTKLSKARGILRERAEHPVNGSRELTCRHVSELVYGIQESPKDEAEFFMYKMTLTKTYTLLEYLHDEGFLNRREENGIYFWSLREKEKEDEES